MKVHEGRPNIEDLIRSGLVQLVINTPIGSQALHDDAYLRRAALEYNIPTFTTIPGAKAAIKAIKHCKAIKLILILYKKFTTTKFTLILLVFLLID